MNKTLLIQGGRIIDPVKKIDRVGSLLLQSGKIIWLGVGDAQPDIAINDVFKADGLIVCPGFIDWHCHLREPGFEAKETIATGVRAASKGGFTTICCMPNTNPPLDNLKTIDFVKTKAEKEAITRVLPVACITQGRKGAVLVDMKALAQTGIAGFSDDGEPVVDDIIMREALIKSRELALPIIDHCEDPVGGPPTGEVKMVARDLALAAETGGWIHIAHVSTAEAVDLIRRAKQQRVKVTAEVSPHHLEMTEEIVQRCGTMAKVNPPLRTTADRRALITALKEGVIDFIATDHAPHTSAEKQKEFALAPSGISGFETAFGSLMFLVHDGKFTINELIACLTSKPAAFLGKRFEVHGSLAVGNTADITIIDPNKKWLVNANKFVSKGKNTPLSGQALKGKVMATLYSGKLVYQADEISASGMKK